MTIQHKVPIQVQVTVQYKTPAIGGILDEQKSLLAALQAEADQGREGAKGLGQLVAGFYEALLINGISENAAAHITAEWISAMTVAGNIQTEDD